MVARILGKDDDRVRFSTEAPIRKDDRAEMCTPAKREPPLTRCEGSIPSPSANEEFDKVLSYLDRRSLNLSDLVEYAKERCPTCGSPQRGRRWYAGTTNKERNNYIFMPWPHGTGFINECPNGDWHDDLTK